MLGAFIDKEEAYTFFEVITFKPDLSEQLDNKLISEPVHLPNFRGHRGLLRGPAAKRDVIFVQSIVPDQSHQIEEPTIRR